MIIINNDWTGNVNAVYTTIGASNHISDERETNDYYATDPTAINILIEQTGEIFSNVIWEPACGEGHMSKRLTQYGFNVTSTDIVNRGYGVGGIDFLNNVTYARDNGITSFDIITNPPYKYALEFIEKSMSVLNEGCKAAFFLKLTFLEGKSRKDMFKRYHPRIYVSSSRIPCAKNGDFAALKESGGSAVGYAWYVFEKGYRGESCVKWVN